MLNDAFAVYPEGSPLNNVFCPTGPGGGIDPTCSPGGSKRRIVGDQAGLAIAPKIRDYLTKGETAEYKKLASERGTLLNTIRLGRGTDADRARAEEIGRRLDEIDAKGRERLKKGDRPADSFDQPDFLNAAIRISTDLDPEPLLDVCKAIEAERGRMLGGPRHGPRTLDVDLLLLGDLELTTGRLTLPHREVTSRRFVLVPLLELDPELALPDGRRLRDCLDALGDRERVEASGPLG